MCYHAGEADQVVPHAAGEKTSKFIKTFNNSHKFKSYPGLGHSSDPQVSRMVAGGWGQLGGEERRERSEGGEGEERRRGGRGEERRGEGKEREER